MEFTPERLQNAINILEQGMIVQVYIWSVFAIFWVVLVGWLLYVTHKDK